VCGVGGGGGRPFFLPGHHQTKSLIRSMKKFDFKRDGGAGGGRAAPRAPPPPPPPPPPPIYVAAAFSATFHNTLPRCTGFPDAARIIRLNRPRLSCTNAAGGARNTMSSQNMDRTQNLKEYARCVCKELGWPATVNQTLFCECIENLAHSRAGGDLWSGFELLMLAIEAAKTAGTPKVDHWFFKDAKYIHVLDKLKKPPPAAESPKKPPAAVVAAPEVFELLRKPN